MCGVEETQVTESVMFNITTIYDGLITAISVQIIQEYVPSSENLDHYYCSLSGRSPVPVSFSKDFVVGLREGNFRLLLRIVTFYNLHYNTKK